MRWGGNERGGDGSGGVGEQEEGMERKPKARGQMHGEAAEKHERQEGEIGEALKN